MNFDRSLVAGLTISAVLHGAVFLVLSYRSLPITPAKPPAARKGEYAIRISLSNHPVSLPELTPDRSEKGKEEEEDNGEPEKEDNTVRVIDFTQEKSKTEKEAPEPVSPIPSPPSEAPTPSPPIEPDRNQVDPPPPERTKTAPLRQEKESESVAKPSLPPPVQPSPPATPGLREGVRLLGKLSPHYPKRCQRTGHEGRVSLKVNVDTSGNVISVRVINSAGCEKLDQAAIEAVREAMFQPARIGTKPIPSTIILPVVFRLTDP